jgi:hypothetical protein
MEVFLVDTAGILWLIWYEVTRMRLNVKYEFLIAAIISVAAYFPLHGQNLSIVPSSGSDGQYDQVIPVNDSTSRPGTSQAQAPPSTLPTPGNTRPQNSDSKDTQSKRIFWIIPNYRAVSADTFLPPESPKEKFKLATQDSFDYSSFVLAGLLAGYGQATNSTREFQQELSGYGRYYWHSFVDEAVGNYFTEAIMPLATHEDPRYYTLGHTHGTVLHRTAYAVSRLAITRTDSGSETFNFSEIVGNALGAGVSNAYYPRQERTWGSNADKWAVQIGIDGIADILKEFWPDIRRDLFRKKQ